MLERVSGREGVRDNKLCREIRSKESEGVRDNKLCREIRSKESHQRQDPPGCESLWRLLRY